MQVCNEYEIMKTTNSKRTYIMQGNTKEKTLDIYHLILAPTYACNLRCRHCYLSDHAKKFLPKDIVIRLVDEWSQIVLEDRGQYEGIFHIKGGEPFVMSYLWDIINRLIELQSLRLMLTTNGTFLEEDIFRMLSNCKDAIDGHVTVIVSLDGATEDTHAILRGKGRFVKVLKFLEGLRRHRINFYLNCVLHAGNIHELLAYIDLAKEYGATQVNFLSFVPRGIGSGFRHFQVLHLEIYRQLDTIYKSADEETKELLAGNLPHIKHHEISRHYRTSHECVAFYRGMFYITPDGNVYTCPNIVLPEFSIGNVFLQHLKEIFDDLPFFYEQLKKHNGPYICAGEKILYEKTNDQSNKQSLDRLQYNLTNLREQTLEKLASRNLVSYCFSRNW